MYVIKMNVHLPHQVYLLWTFSSDDQSEPITNEGLGSAKKSSVTEKTPNPVEKFVQTDVLDLATVEKNGSLVLTLGLTVLQPGT